MHEEIKQLEELEVEGGTIPVTLWSRTEGGAETWGVDVDGVNWFEVDNRTHAAVLFRLMADHLTDYMHYEITR